MAESGGCVLYVPEWENISCLVATLRSMQSLCLATNHSHGCNKEALQEDWVSGCVCVQLFQKDICLNLCGIEKKREFFLFTSF